MIYVILQFCIVVCILNTKVHKVFLLPQASMSVQSWSEFGSEFSSIALSWSSHTGQKAALCSSATEWQQPLTAGTTDKLFVSSYKDTKSLVLLCEVGAAQHHDKWFFITQGVFTRALSRFLFNTSTAAAVVWRTSGNSITIIIKNNNNISSGESCHRPFVICNL